MIKLISWFNVGPTFTFQCVTVHPQIVSPPNPTASPTTLTLGKVLWYPRVINSIYGFASAKSWTRYFCSLDKKCHASNPGLFFQTGVLKLLFNTSPWERAFRKPCTPGFCWQLKLKVKFGFSTTQRNKCQNKYQMFHVCADVTNWKCKYAAILSCFSFSTRNKLAEYFKYFSLHQEHLLSLKDKVVVSLWPSQNFTPWQSFITID